MFLIKLYVFKRTNFKDTVRPTEIVGLLKIHKLTFILLHNMKTLALYYKIML